jgi:hypothetical protein
MVHHFRLSSPHGNKSSKENTFESREPTMFSNVWQQLSICLTIQYHILSTPSRTHQIQLVCLVLAGEVGIWTAGPGFVS